MLAWLPAKNHTKLSSSMHDRQDAMQESRTRWEQRHLFPKESHCGKGAKGNSWKNTSRFWTFGENKTKPKQLREKRVGYKIRSRMNIAINVTQPGHWDHSNFFYAAGINGCPCSEQSGVNICILESISFSVGIQVGKIVMWVEANPPETWLNDE